MRNPVAVAPDWSRTGTVAELERDIGNIGFDGPGLYIDAKGFAIIVAADVDEHPWKQKWPKETVFRFYYWNCPFADSVFGQDRPAPVRRDTR